MPNLDMWRAVAVDPFHNPFSDPTAHYIVWNWLSPFLAWALKVNGVHSYFYFHLAFSVAFTAVFIFLVFSQLDENDARTSLVLFLAIPASSTAYFWVGMDSVTLFLMLLLLAFRRSLPLVLLFGIALGMQHFEQAFCATAALTCALLVTSAFKDKIGYSIRWGITSVAGVVLGKLVLIALVKHYGIHVNSGRAYYLHQYLQLILNEFYYHFEYILWSVLGVGWIAAAKLVDNAKRAVPFFISLFGLMLLLPVVSDETRVVCIVTFPLFAAYILLNREFLRSLDGRITASIFGLWILVPWPYVLGGTPKWSVFPFDIAFLLHKYFGWFNVPTNQPMWPF